MQYNVYSDEDYAKLQAELEKVKQERDVYQHAASDFDETAKAFRDDRDAIMKRAEQAEADLSEALELLDKLAAWFPNCAQLLDGWHADGTAWSEWDESVRQELTSIHAEAARLRERHKK